MSAAPEARAGAAAGHGAERWHLAVRAAHALALSPDTLGGIVVRARPGPVRDAWIGLLRGLSDRPIHRLPASLTPEALHAGLDLSETLRTGRTVMREGLLARMTGGIALVPMAERIAPGLAAQIGLALDAGSAPTLVLLDEGADPDEAVPGVLADRLALHVGLDALPMSVLGDHPGARAMDSGRDPAGAPQAVGPEARPNKSDTLRANALDSAAPDADAPQIPVPSAVLRQTNTPDQSAPEGGTLAKPPADPDDTALRALTGLAAACGIVSLRVPAQALALARALARLDGAAAIAEAHVADAAALAILPRARVMPDMPPEDADAPEQPDPPPPDNANDTETPPDPGETKDTPLEDRVLEAMRAILPDLALAAARSASRGSADSGAGARMSDNTHGRPAGTRPGTPERGRRLDVLGTLRTAAPWQPVRRQARTRSAGADAGVAARVLVEPSDFRIKRFERPAESVMIFVVDASGSAAASRMAEAKGAVELMLAEAYQRREKVALIAFRGAGAEVLLEPTRALVQAKRRLTVLPGGGGTPLASALVAAGEMARAVRRRGGTPYLIFLTDGRGNIALSGAPGRVEARADQDTAARMLAAEGVVTVLIDTANRPQPDAAVLAGAMGARYLPLPRADAAGINRAVRAATGSDPVR